LYVSLCQSLLLAKADAFGRCELHAEQEHRPEHGEQHHGQFGGWSLYAKRGKATFHYNTLGIKRFNIAATTPIPTGKTQVRMEFAYDGGGMGKGGTVTLYCDGKEVGKGRVQQTQGIVFSVDETTDIGHESGTTVSADYTTHQPLQRNDQVGADRSRQGRRGRRSRHFGRRALPRRSGAAVVNGRPVRLWPHRCCRLSAFGKNC
jgi:hypothetical protein